MYVWHHAYSLSVGPTTLYGYFSLQKEAISALVHTQTSSFFEMYSMKRFRAMILPGLPMKRLCMAIVLGVNLIRAYTVENPPRSGSHHFRRTVLSFCIQLIELGLQHLGPVVWR